MSDPAYDRLLAAEKALAATKLQLLSAIEGECRKFVAADARIWAVVRRLEESALCALAEAKRYQRPPQGQWRGSEHRD